MKAQKKPCFAVKTSNVIMSNCVIDKSVNLKQKSEFCYDGGEGGRGAGDPQ